MASVDVIHLGAWLAGWQQLVTSVAGLRKEII